MTQQSSEILAKVKSARRVSVPLVAINTPDPAATINQICGGINGESVKLEWDFIRGIRGRGNEAKEWIAANAEDGACQSDPVSALVLASALPEKGILFLHLSHRWIAEPAVVQAIWNLRDQFKANYRMLILLGPHIELPRELSDDVIVFDEPLPNAEQLAQIVADCAKSASMTIDAETTGRAVEALRGLSSFAAEQITAMSQSREGLDVDALWERKRQQIEQTPGLKVYRGGDGFESIGGCDVVKGFLSRIMQGHGRPNACVFVDEIEKAMGGAKGDTSGVTQDQLGTLLSYMQDNNAAGMIFIGPPGAAKSAIAKAAGNEGGVPTIQLDLGAAKGSLVGQSEQQLRQAMKVITAVSNGKALFIATCNSIGELPPELRRRFTLGTFFFDLPTADEREAIWRIWQDRYFDPDDPNRHASGHSEFDLPNDEGWTGAEIRQCCDISWRLGCKLTEAAQFVVPVSRSAADQLRRLREQASGRFLSASRPGVYVFDKGEPVPATGRAVALLE